MQRLFSTFPEGWPGTGLLFLRAAAAIPAVQYGIANLMAASSLAHAVLPLMATVAAALLLVGSWTPVAGALLAGAEMFLAFSHSSDPKIHIVLGVLGAALAMLGPGGWSVDARRFGRKRLQFPQR